ncbi:MAG: polyisoprenoid-binding protein [Actinobacteria bacterium]|nr:polyisoprenoid-binding protein [Actinomycetota bacterium]
MIPAGTYTIERDHSELGFNVRHAGIAKVRGKFTEYDGTIVIAEDIAQSSAEVTMQTASIFTGSEARDNHLRSADFFDAENKPTVTFRSSGVRVNDDDEFVLVGDLTLNGVTRPVELDVEYNGAATDPFGFQRIGFEAKTRVNRKDFGLTWNAALETGGVLVSDQVTIQLEVSAVKQA